MRALILAALLTGCLGGCGSLPMNGELLDAVRDEVEPVSCQCNVYCGT